MRAEIETLDCGMEAVFVQHKPEYSGTSVRLSFGTGALHEREGDVPGSAHYLEHVALLTGTRSYPTTKRLIAAVDANDADFNAWTDWTDTTITMVGMKADFVINLCLEMGFMPTLTPAGIDQDRTAISEEARARMHSPQAAVFDSVSQLFVGDHPSRSTTGTLANVAEVSHEGITRFHRQHWTTGNARLYVVSDQSVRHQRKVANAFFKDFDGHSQIKPRPTNLDLPWLRGNSQVAIEHSLDAEQQAEIAIAISLPTPETFEESVLDEASTDFLRAALWRQIRVGRNITYHATLENCGYSNTNNGAKESYNALLIETAIRSGDVSRIFDSLDRLAEGIPAMRGLAANILREYVYYLNGKDLYSKTELVDDILGSEQLFYSRVYNPREERKIVRQLRACDVLARAREMLERDRILHTAGPANLTGGVSIAAATRVS